jgi:hypothetical protein
MRLAELQTVFQAGVLNGDETILDSIKDSQRTGRAALFAVYHDAYRLRLAEFLANDFPILRLYLGEEAFGSLVEDYIESMPSRHRNARWYGGRLPEFMQETTAWRTNKNAMSLALFERALADAFDAADAPIAAIESLRSTSSDDWPHLILDFHPGVAVLDLASGSAEAYAALAEGQEPGSNPLLAERWSAPLSPCRGRRMPCAEGGDAGQDIRGDLFAFGVPEQ